ncbi:MAG: AP-1 complex subunit sigma-1-like protein [Amphiamblys sp. WSBS2006]|nr:MAG: AP-1 complex subunit sigma-1-like protein [Amphiamblys sp. WSBS2006]
MLHGVVVVNEQGRIRFAKAYTEKYPLEKTVEKIKEIEGKKGLELYEMDSGLFLVFKKYGTVFFVFCVDECCFLYVSEQIHLFVEEMDKVFDGFSEFDFVFNFHKIEPVLDKYGPLL